MNANPPPIFLLGSERSGSNLIRTLLGNHSMVDAPVAPHFFDAFIGLLRFYGDLHESPRMLRLLEDLHAYVQHPFHDWALKATPMEIQERYHPKGFFAACDALWRAKAAQGGKATFMSKDNHLFQYAFEIEAQWPDARFIYLYRDPRDHCASWVTTPFHLKTVQDMVAKWDREQRRCLLLHESHDMDLCFVGYEDLITDTPLVMSRVLKHCGLPVEEACFQTDPAKATEAGRLKLWENLDKPIMRENKRKYAKVLTPEQVKQVETVSGAMMRRLGYTLDTQADWQPGPLHRFRKRLEWRALDRRSRSLKDEELRLIVEKQDFLARLRYRLQSGN